MTYDELIFLANEMDIRAQQADRRYINTRDHGYQLTARKCRKLSEKLREEAAAKQSASTGPRPGYHKAP